MLTYPVDEVRVYLQHSHRWEGPCQFVCLFVDSVYVTNGLKVRAVPLSACMPTPAQDRVPDLTWTVKAISCLASATAVHLVEECRPQDPRATSKQWISDMETDVGGLFERGLFTIVPAQEVTKGVKVLSRRFIRAIKNPSTNSAEYRARCVVQGH